MKHHRLSLGAVIGAATSLALLYMWSIILDLWLALILGLYVSATIALFWMVFRILKDPYSTDRTFDDYFYQDRDDLRRHGTE
jgi:hypothetical protein